MILRDVFAGLRAFALEDPMARATQDISAHRVILRIQGAPWSVILTVNR